MEKPDRLKEQMSTQSKSSLAKTVVSKFRIPDKKLPEKSIVVDDFDHVIGRLNKILYREHRIDDLRIKEGKRSLYLVGVLEKESKPDTIVEEFKNYFKKKVNYNSVKKIFNLHNLEPQFGDKNLDKKFGNNNIVIGLNGRTFQYRVDYDERKGLHINLTTINGVQLAICINTPSSTRFGLNNSHYTDKQLAQIIKYKFWIKMTLGYYLSTNKLEDYKNAFQFFFHESEIGFDMLKGIACNYAHKKNEKEVYSAVEKCNNEADLATLFFKNESVRDALIDTIINNLSKKSIIGTHAMKEHDSEQADYSKTAENSSESDSRVRKYRR